MLFLFAGAFRGIAELLWFHHTKSIWSAKVHPMSFFGARSDLRKYKFTRDRMAAAYPAPENWYYKIFDIRYKERFPLSATFMVWLTDGAHMSNMLMRVCLSMACITATWNFNPAASSWHELVKLLAYYFIAWSLGFLITHNLIFQRR